MPFYEYLCKNCGHILEELQTMSEPELVTCPVCKHDTLKKMIGSGSGIIFKGSGFYQTDYKKKSSSGSKVIDTTSSGTDTTTGKDTQTTSKDSTTTSKDTSKGKDTSGKDTSSKSKDSSSKKTDLKTDKKKNK
jgi:putative FmdB family regulatory protein